MLLDNTPLEISQLFLATLGTRMYTYYQDRVPKKSAVLVVSNHRSFMDAPILMTALQRPIRFACHHYMGQVPVMREVVTSLGCFPLDAPQERQQSFFHKAVHLLKHRQVVGIFPEGTEPMVKTTDPNQMGSFQRGFAHLALRAPIDDLAVVPIAIASTEELTGSAVPLKLLSFFDPSEPLFAESGWHPLVMYRRVNVLIGRPHWISASQRKDYQGKQARSRVADLTETCHTEIKDLLRQGCY